MSRNRKIFYFPGKKLQKLHMETEDLWRVSAEEGWQKSPVSPMEVLRLFDRLSLKEGFELVAYVFRSGLRGRGVVWAVPEGHFPEIRECERLDSAGTPRPKSAVSPSMVLDGDGSPESYIQASLFLREMEEFGALWDELEWGLHEIIDGVPEGYGIPEGVDPRPKVILEERPVTEFLTVQLLERRIYRHFDVFEGYSPAVQVDERV